MQADTNSENGLNVSANKKRKMAIAIAIESGKVIQLRFPEIVNDYRNDMSAREIVAKYDLVNRLRINQKAAESAVGYAIRGYDGNLRHLKNLHAYPGLIINPAELESLKKKHWSLSIHKQMKSKTGLFGRTPEQLSTMGTQRAIARGFVPYSPEENEQLLWLTEKLNFCAKDVAVILNINFHYDSLRNGVLVRKHVAIWKQYSKLRKRREKAQAS